MPGSYEELGRAVTALEGFLTKKISDSAPTVIGYAEAFIRKFKVKPENLVPLFAFMGAIEAAAFKFQVECVTVNESAARKALMGMVPKKTKDIKIAALTTCKRLGWPACDGHAADALIVADYISNCIRPGRGHQHAPLFGGRP